jgi:hypothetical protein
MPLLSYPGESGKVDRVCLSRSRGRDHDPGERRVLELCRGCQERCLAGGGSGHIALSVFTSLLPPQASSFPFFSLLLAKPDIWPSAVTAAADVAAKAAWAGVTRDTAGVEGDEGRGSSWESLAVSSLQDFLPA